MNINIPADLKIVNLLNPAADAAGRTSSVYASLKDVTKAWVVAYYARPRCHGVQIDVLQATTVAGTGSKALTNEVPIFAALDVATSDALAAQTVGGCIIIPILTTLANWLNGRMPIDNREARVLYRDCKCN